MEESVVKELANVLSLERLLIAAALVALTWLALHLLGRLSALLSERFTKLRLVIATANPVLRIVAWIACVSLIVFVVFKPPLNTLLAVGASVGLAFGLGAQDLIRNLIAGVLMLFERPFLVGDMVEVGGHYGEVRDIGLRATTLRTFDDNLVTLPNALVLGQAISNSNAGVLDEMVVVELTVAAGADPLLVRELAYEAALASPYVFLRKAITVTLEDFYDKAHLTRVRIKAYVMDVRDEPAMSTDVTLRMKQRAIAHGLIAADAAPAPAG